MKLEECVPIRILKETLPPLTASLAVFYIFMHIYKYYNPYAFPGIEERIHLIILPCLYLTVIFYFPFQRAATLKKAFLSILSEKIPEPTSFKKRARFNVLKLKFLEKVGIRKIISSENSQKALIKKRGLTGEDFMFLLGLGLLILLLVLAHPSTPKIEHDGLMLWMSLTLLFFSIGPEYVNAKTAKKWLDYRRGKRFEGLYRQIYHMILEGRNHLKGDFFFVTAMSLFLIGVFLYFQSGSMPEFVFGVSYGAFVRALLK